MLTKAINTTIRHYKAGNINWPMAIYIAVAHIAAVIGIYSIPSCNKWTLLWAFILWPIR